MKTEHHGYIVYSFVWVRGKILLTWPRGHYFGFSRCGVLNVEAENITRPRPLSWPWRQLWGQNFDFGLILLAVAKALVLNLLPRPWGAILALSDLTNTFILKTRWKCWGQSQCYEAKIAAKILASRPKFWPWLILEAKLLTLTSAASS